MNKIEQLASRFEVTVDYILEEFVIDDELKFPELFVYEFEDSLTFVDFA